MLSYLMTVPSRLPVAQLTLESARQAGFDPVVVCDVGLDGPRVMFERLLLSADQIGQAIVIMQDDITCAAGLAEYLDRSLLLAARSRGWVLSCFCTARNQHAEFGWHPIKGPSRADGAQCYALTPGARTAILKHWAGRDWSDHRKSWAMVDHWVGVACKAAGIEYWVHSPSLVQHVLPEHGTLPEAGDPSCRLAEKVVWDGENAVKLPRNPPFGP